MKIFLIDDDASIRIGIGDDLREAGHTIYDFENPLTALHSFTELEPDCVLCDYNMPQLNGLDTLKKIKELESSAIVIMITAFGNIELAVECLKAGAFDFITKPFEIGDINHTLNKIKDFVDLKIANRQMKQTLQSHSQFQNLIGSHELMYSLFKNIETIAPSDATVLIEGETGTGKELVAEAIHFHSERKDKPIIKVTCAVFTKTLLESELFGHEKGAFTGAHKQKIGRIEQAQGGTLFLDEIDDLDFDVQVKLLRFLQERTFERVGGEKLLSSDVRIIVATKANLADLVKAGSFREDLYYRLNVLPIHIPSLKDRITDLPLLIKHFADKFSLGTEITLEDAALQKLMHYTWPGNVRQLEHLVQRLCLTSANACITPEDLPKEYFEFDTDKTSEEQPSLFNLNEHSSFESIIKDVEKNILTHALDKSGGNQKTASKLLKLPYSTFRNKLDKHSIS
ncbi:MAG: sigma-54 dependent transcriptional regulator [Fibrobacterales bacterium]